MAEAAQAEQRRIVIPYSPRKHFLAAHASKKRFEFDCRHRRAGKTVYLVNRLGRAALENKRKYPFPRYIYLADTYSHAKDLAWRYLTHSFGEIPGMDFKATELRAIFPNGAEIRLYSGDRSLDSIIGTYIDGAALDEYPLLSPYILDSVINPCLADFKGFCIISGTIPGRPDVDSEHFHALYRQHLNDPDWDIFITPVTETDAIDPEEVERLRRDMSATAFAREMLCDFNVPAEDAIYVNELNAAEIDGRITSIPYEPSLPVVTWWDIGMDDRTAIWFAQYAGREIRLIDFYECSGKGLPHYVETMKNKPYQYAPPIVPHDIQVREWLSGVSRIEVMANRLGWHPVQAPNLSVEDGIDATRAMFGMCIFDRTKCAQGLTSLRNYFRAKTGKPSHTWASDAADAFRMGAVSRNLIEGVVCGVVSRFDMGTRRRFRRRIRGTV